MSTNEGVVQVMVNFQVGLVLDGELVDKVLQYWQDASKFPPGFRF
ncbi:hypothetical protein [Orrella daihaiensis]|nr:hypothetical protein [Orrella daihaiensis]